jgi:hypothetical protein
MTFIEPLDLKTWLINVLAGDASYFTILGIFFILSFSAFFRMRMLAMGFVVMIFLLMFSGYIPATLLVFVSIFAGLLVGHVASRFFK